MQMRTLLILLFFGASLNVVMAQQKLAVGDPLPTLTVPIVGGVDVQVNAWQGRVVILEFWEPWCGPCLKGLNHLADLKNTIGDDLEVVAISREKPERITAFMKNTGHPFWFSEFLPVFDSLFSHRVIPHSVVISPAGSIAAITAPEHITEETIRDLMAGRETALPLKSDVPWNPELTIFERDSTVDWAFEIQPARPDAPTYSKSYPKGPFRDRRFTYINFKIPYLYREALQTTAYRMEIPEMAERQYCVDIVVPARVSDQWSEVLLDSLGNHFGWEVDTIMQSMDVWVVRAAEEGIQLASAKKKAPTSASGAGFSSEGATLQDFADYLEGFGLAGMPVVNETGSADQLYDIGFSFQPEDTSTFWKAIREMGLNIKKEERTIPVFRVQPAN